MQFQLAGSVFTAETSSSRGMSSSCPDVSLSTAADQVRRLVMLIARGRDSHGDGSLAIWRDRFRFQIVYQVRTGGRKSLRCLGILGHHYSFWLFVNPCG